MKILPGFLSLVLLMTVSRADTPVTVFKSVSVELPVRALMLLSPPPSSLEKFLDFVRHDLPREGVNHLIFQIDYAYEYKTHPELVAKNAYTRAQIKSLVAACREAHIKLIPLVNCLGHQSWAKTNNPLLTVYPQFPEFVKHSAILSCFPVLCTLRPSCSFPSLALSLFGRWES